MERNMEDWPETVPGRRSETVTGVHIRLRFDKEPGEAYGESRDSYMIETEASDGIKSCVCFSTLDEIEEFARHLEEYVRRERSSE